jgi:UDP-N-acetylmuramoyl-tripeptide--D-alanyl-D-alanine ligase
MQHFETIAQIATNIVVVLTFGFYLITNLQWYNYKIERVILKHHRPLWHTFYFIIPFILYYTTGQFFMIFFYFAYLPALYLWYKRLDKKLVFTWRVKRFFILLIGLVLFQDFLCTVKNACETYGVFLPLAMAYIGSTIIEKYLFLVYKKQAKKKLQSIENLQIIAITGSYGKTSIKNFVTQILQTKFQTYMTPRSVNTLGGIIKDVNESLPQNTAFYVAEAGARERGDIYEITTFLEPQNVVVAKVGYAHIEYFKSLENIIRTKLEIMATPRLQKAYIHCSVTDEPHEKVEFFCEDEILDLEADLNGLRFCVDINGTKECFEVPHVLGAFQATNILVAIKIALYFGMSIQEVQKAVKKLQGVEHRLQKIQAGGKIILDDGFNGNIDGMKEAVRLCSLHKGRKVIVTPGLVESTDTLNEELIKNINAVFDVVIVTGKLNAELFKKHLHVKQKFFLEDKAKLQELLASQTKEGDIILFANDAPNFI